MSPAEPLNLIDGSELLLLLECCDAPREQLCSLRGSNEKYQNAAAALEEAAKLAMGENAAKLTLLTNPPLSKLPAELAARYTAPKKVGHSVRRYPRLGAFEYGYVLLHEGELLGHGALASKLSAFAFEHGARSWRWRAAYWTTSIGGSTARSRRRPRRRSTCSSRRRRPSPPPPRPQRRTRS